MEEFPSFPSLSAQFQVVILYFSFAAPSEQLYTDTFPLVFLKFLSLLPDPTWPFKDEELIKWQKAPKRFCSVRELRLI